jgi:hypothetical protein
VPEAAAEGGDDKKVRYPKRKVGLLLGYKGTNYIGLQRYVHSSWSWILAHTHTHRLMVPRWCDGLLVVIAGLMMVAVMCIIQ